MRLNYCIFIWLVLAGPASGQREAFLEDYKKISDNYFAMPHAEVRANYKLYAGHTGKKPVSTSSSVVKIKNREIHQEIENIITLANKDFMVMIDREDKTILFDQTPREFFNTLWSVNLQANQHAIKDVVKKEETAASRTYLLTFSYGEVEKMTIRYHPKTYKLISMELYYAKEDSYYDDEPDRKDKARLLIELNYTPYVSQGFYTIAENPYFVHQKNDKLKLKPAFNTYELIDNRIKLE